MKSLNMAVCLFLALTSLPIMEAATSADETPRVSLYLTHVSAHETQHGTRFRCKVKIVNDTGKRLSVTSNFHSVFDGLELVVTDVDGKLLRQRPYTFHQSPFTSDGREIPLARGKTEADIVFPISNFGMVGQPLKIRLVGTLPGSSYSKILSTETSRVDISKQESR